MSHTDLGFIQNLMPYPPTAFVRINWNPVLVLLMEVFPDCLNLTLKAGNSDVQEPGAVLHRVRPVNGRRMTALLHLIEITLFTFVSLLTE